MKITVLDIGCLTNGDIDISALNKFGEVDYYDIVDQEKLIPLIKDSEIVLVNKAEMTREVIFASPKLKFIGACATGVNNIDLAAAKEKGVIVSNIPNYSTEGVSNLTLSFILQFATNLVRYANSTAKGDWTSSPRFTYFPYPMTELSGKTVGIFGMGAIGTRVAMLCSAFGMKVIYTSRTKKDLPYEMVPFEELLRRSDFLTLHAPLTNETLEIINAKTIAQMKKTAFIINTARGRSVNEKDVAEALKNGDISGYAADVLSTEPQAKDSPFIGAPNVILTPHIAWAALETRQRLFDILCANVKAYISGAPINTVE